MLGIVALVVLWGSGCSRFFSGTSPDGAAAHDVASLLDATSDSARDGTPPADGRADSGPADVVPLDAGPPDATRDTGRADATLDGAPVDLTRPSECGSSAFSSLLFVTSENWRGNLGGIAGADTRCETAAAAAALSGTFVALISTKTDAAVTRLASQIGYPVLNTLGRVVEPCDLFDGNGILRPILDEYGVEAATPAVWTGSTETGAAAYATGIDALGDCRGWASSSTASRGGVGGPTNVTGAWLGSGGTGSLCNSFLRLYCVRVGP